VPLVLTHVVPSRVGSYPEGQWHSVVVRLWHIIHDVLPEEQVPAEDPEHPLGQVPHCVLAGHFSQLPPDWGFLYPLLQEL